MENKKMPVPQFLGQANSYIYNILQDINKFKILLVFIYKGFSWHRELKSLGIYNNIIEETLNEFNNIGIIDLRELNELDNIQYETLKGVKQDIQHYYKIYFSNNRIFEMCDSCQEDINYLLDKNIQLKEFINIVNDKLKPFILKQNQILREEKTQLTRNVTLNGVTFEKDTLFSKEIKQLTSTKRNLMLREIKPLALMTDREKRQNINKVYINGKKTNSSIFKDIEQQDKASNDDFINGYIGKSLISLGIEREQQDKDIFNLFR